MTDDDIGRLASAILKDLEADTTEQGRVLTLARALWHVDASAREEQRRTGAGAQFQRAPGADECLSVLNAARKKPFAPEEAAAFKAKFQKLSLGEISRVRHVAAEDIEQLVVNAPGPMTTCFRRLAAVMASAHLACQWGCFREATPMLQWCLGVLYRLRPPRGEAAKGKESRLEVEFTLALVAAQAVEHPYPTLTTGLARQLAADLGAMARAAARIEGAPEVDIAFTGPAAMVETIGGLNPATAEAVVREAARFFEIPWDEAGALVG